MQAAVVFAAGRHGDGAGVVQVAQPVVLVAAVCAARDIAHVDHDPFRIVVCASEAEFMSRVERGWYFGDINN